MIRVFFTIDKSNSEGSFYIIEMKIIKKCQIINNLLISLNKKNFDVYCNLEFSKIIEFQVFHHFIFFFI